jgi:hypothetical protein
VQFVFDVRRAAVVKIQGLVRRWISLKIARVAVAANYEKFYDAGTGTYYYFNSKTGASLWTKPKLQGSSALEGTVLQKAPPRAPEGVTALAFEDGTVSLWWQTKHMFDNGDNV